MANATAPATQAVQDAGRTPEAFLAQNRQLIDLISDSAEGEIKQASAAGTNMIRRRIREEGFLRRIIPPQTVTNADLNRVLEHDRPLIIEDMEPSSPAAKSIPFGDAADISFYYGNKFAVVFYEVTTPEFVKDINELRTYKMDLRQVVTDNALKDVQTEEDGKFISTVDEICGAAPDVASSATGLLQWQTITGGFTRATYAQVLSGVENRNLNNGVILMNRRTAKNFLNFDRSEIGGDLAQSLFTDGLTALQEAKIYGVPHIFTIKRDLVPDNVVYVFTEPGYLGRFYELQALTMYLEKRKNILRHSARETIGFTIANTGGVQKFTFAP